MTNDRVSHETQNDFKNVTNKKVNKKQVVLSLNQECPTEPLDKTPALQGRIALAGKLNICHMHLLENLYKHHAGWEFMLSDTGSS